MTERAREDVESLLDGLREILTIAGIPEQQINVATGPSRMFGKDKPLPPEEEECATSDS
jgi:hypothetical protein